MQPLEAIAHRLRNEERCQLLDLCVRLARSFLSEHLRRLEAHAEDVDGTVHWGLEDQEQRGSSRREG